MAKKPRDCVLDISSPGSTIVRGKKLHTREHAERLAKAHKGWVVRYVGPTVA
jgi:hypothetical protein